jgi:hypothetical protein
MMFIYTIVVGTLKSIAKQIAVGTGLGLGVSGVLFMIFLFVQYLRG